MSNRCCHKTDSTVFISELKKTGDLSKPLDLGDGKWSVLELTGIRPEKIQTLQQADGAIRGKLWREEREAALEKLINDLRAEALKETALRYGARAGLYARTREINRLLFNSGPTAKPVLTSQTNTLAGSIGGSDPEGDPLSYAIAKSPTHGSVVVDSAGNFTYTADESLAATGGQDTFVVEVRDTGFHLNLWVPTTISVPVTVTVPSEMPAARVEGARRSGGTKPRLTSTVKRFPTSGVITQ